MGITREEAIKILQHLAEIISNGDYQEAFMMSVSALHPVSREQVEKVFSGCINCHDKERLAKHIHCWPSFCPACGRPLTDVAVQMVLERMEALGNDAQGTI